MFSFKVMLKLTFVM